MINLILSETPRSYEYLKKLHSSTQIKKIIYYSKNKGRVHNFLSKYYKKKTLFIKEENINKISIKNFSEIQNSEFNIVSLNPGEIVKKDFLLKKKLIHAHPGDLPRYKGSTTIYYTILEKKKICVSIFILKKKIDSGKILYKKYFKKPKNLISIEKNFDNEIRSKTLVEFLKNKKKIKRKYLNKFTHQYYIAHPILRSMVLKKKFIKNIFIKSFK